jgi:hypothetical protein
MLAVRIMAQADISLLQQLGSNSCPYHDPLTYLDWSALSTSDYWLPQSAISLQGLAEFEQLPEATKRRLSQYEFIVFIQAGLWLESLFIRRLGERLNRTASLTQHAYYLHEIREEAGHSLMFLQLIEKSGLYLPGMWQRPPRLADFLGRHAPVGSALFWLAVVIGEELPDKLNRHVRVHGNGEVNATIAQMCTLHIIDEARHIAQARSALESAVAGMGGLHKRALSPVIALLLRQFVRSFYVPGAEVYELAGLTPGNHWRELAHNNPARREFVGQCVAPTLNLLRGHGFKLAAPTA